MKKSSNMVLVISLLISGFTLLSIICGIIVLKGIRRRRKEMIDDVNSDKDVVGVKVTENDAAWA